MTKLFEPNLSKHYSLEYLLGCGGSGSVYRATRKRDNMPVAVKLIAKKKISSDRLAIDTDKFGRHEAVPMEIYILKRLCHENIVKLLDYFSDEAFFYIVTELHGEGCWKKRAKTGILKQKKESFPTDLFECIETLGPLPNGAIMKILKQLINVTDYLKSKNVYHLDLKDENICIDSTFNIKLIDFGSAHIISSECGDFKFSHTLLTKFFGTVAYAPPEVLRRLPYSPEKHDVWTIGIILYTMAHGQCPFASPIDTLKNCYAPVHSNINIDQTVANLISLMLNSDPHCRANINELKHLIC